MLRCAWQSIEACTRAQSIEHRTGIDASYFFGAFVTLRHGEELRGCIGELFGLRGDLGAVVGRTAVKSATEDPRFPPLRAAELSTLNVEISLLDTPTATDAADLDPESFGVLVQNGRRRGVLLPAIPGVEDGATQLQIVLHKAGIHPDEEYRLERFAVTRIGGDE